MIEFPFPARPIPAATGPGLEGVQLRYRDTATGKSAEYLYFDGHSTQSLPNTILLAAPVARSDGKRRVGLKDGTVVAMREEEYRGRVRTP